MDFLASPKSRVGWIYQQLLKLYAPFVIEGISSNVLVVDADMIFLHPVRVMTEKAEPFFTVGFEYHLPYFAHMERLLPGLKRVYPEYSGITHHMLFQKPILEDFFHEIRSYHRKEPWKAFLHCIDHQHLYGSSFSEYESYFNFVLMHTNQCHVRRLKYWNGTHYVGGEEDFYRQLGYIFMAAHVYL